MNEFKKNIYRQSISIGSNLSYCTNWTALNNGDIKMSSTGVVNFAPILGDRTINTGVSFGYVDRYAIAGFEGFFSCYIPMTFTLSTANWDYDGFPVFIDQVLTGLRYTINIIFSDVSELDIYDKETYAEVLPDPQLTSEYNDCIPCDITTAIELGYNISSASLACSATPSTYYTDNNPWNTASQINIDNTCWPSAPAGYYSNGSTVRYWSGIGLNTPVGC